MQAQAAANAIAGATPAIAVAPWFWTDQYDCNIQMLGGRVDTRCGIDKRGTRAPQRQTPNRHAAAHRRHETRRRGAAARRPLARPEANESHHISILRR
ncbi:MAG: hypothetical protein CPDRYMAC_2604 [uncultured Paraburkholderia sp.]|nr:MAG: hypothetical protein CPDRYDRY_2490 [uncultured Paraburkholderia sp.]CAH2925677.1 MAG: hypothetical protein CPDRYMAC_2604 [uncultured Paraburkholderia sp.]